MLAATSAGASSVLSDALSSEVVGGVVGSKENSSYIEVDYLQ